MHGHWGTRTPFRSDARGVSPVVGSVLILVIMIISIGGIMTWGVPAIQGLQERAEYQAVLTQFLQMQSDVRGLRDPQNTRISQVSVNDGRLSFDAGSRWVFTAMRDADYEPMYVTGWEETIPPTLTLVDGPAIAAQTITADAFIGGSPTSLYSCAAACGNVLDLDGDNDGTGDVDFSLIDTVVRVRVEEGGNVAFEAWIINMGHIEYHLTERNEQNRLHFEMGAVFSQHNDYFYLEQSPTIKDPDYTLTPDPDETLFVRALQLSGTVPQGVGGRGSFPILFHLVDNYGSARGRPSFPDAEGARIQVHGELEVPFCNFFEERFDSDTGVGWVFEPGGACPSDPDDWESVDVNLRFEFDTVTQDLRYDLSHSVVTTRIRTN